MSFNLSLDLKGEFLRAVCPDGSVFYVPYWNENPQEVVDALVESGTQASGSTLLAGDLNDIEMLRLYIRSDQDIEELSDQYGFSVGRTFDMQKMLATDNPITAVQINASTQTLIDMMGEDRILGIRPLEENRDAEVFQKLDESWTNTP